MIKKCILLTITGYICFRGFFLSAQVKAEKFNYCGWENSYILTNEQVELIIVPEVGRVMSYRLSDGENVIWENPELFGKSLPEKPPEKWFNFGGDKVWPGPQGEFKKVTGRDWPPDEFFDGRKCSVEIVENGLKLTTQVSKYYGARLTREFLLSEKGSVVNIRQRMEKKNFPVIRMTIWSVTQVKSPDSIYIPINHKSRFPRKYRFFDKNAEKIENIDTIDIFLKVTRNPKYSFKIGLDTRNGYLASVHKNTLFTQHFVFVDNKKYPDDGCSVEIYSNADPNAYMEMEILSPLHEPVPGASFSFNIYWTLHKLNNPYDMNEIKKYIKNVKLPKN